MSNTKKIAALLFTALLFGGTVGTADAAAPLAPVINPNLGTAVERLADNIWLAPDNTPRAADDHRRHILGFNSEAERLFVLLMNCDPPVNILTDPRLSPAAIQGLKKYMEALIAKGLTVARATAMINDPEEGRFMLISKMHNVSKLIEKENKEHATRKANSVRVAVRSANACIDSVSLILTQAADPTVRPDALAAQVVASLQANEATITALRQAIADADLGDPNAAQNGKSKGELEAQLASIENLKRAVYACISIIQNNIVRDKEDLTFFYAAYYGLCSMGMGEGEFWLQYELNALRRAGRDAEIIGNKGPFQRRFERWCNDQHKPVPNHRDLYNANF